MRAALTVRNLMAAERSKCTIAEVYGHKRIVKHRCLHYTSRKNDFAQSWVVGSLIMLVLNYFRSPKSTHYCSGVDDRVNGCNKMRAQQRPYTHDQRRYYHIPFVSIRWLPKMGPFLMSWKFGNWDEIMKKPCSWNIEGLIVLLQRRSIAKIRIFDGKANLLHHVMN